MNYQSSLKKNFLMNVLLTISSIVFPLITFPYISRVLLPSGTGKVSFATSLITYFVLFSQLGIPSYGMRAVARVRDNKEELTRITQELLILSIIMVIISYAILFPLIISVPKLEQEKALYIVLSSNIILTSIGMEWFYKGMELYSFITIRSIFFKILGILFMFLLVHSKSDYIVYGAITVFSSSASFILNFFHIRRYISLRPVGNYNFFPHIKPITIFFAMSIATTIYTNLDTVMLGFMTSDIEVGYYNAAVKIKCVLVAFVTSLGAVIMPRASYYLEQQNKKGFYKINSLAIQFTILVAVPLILYFIFFASAAIYFLSGTEYTPAILPMQIIMPTLLLIGLSHVLGLQILVPSGREIVVLYSEIAGALVDLILNFLLIPVFASAGAAAGTLAAECTVLLWQFISIRNEITDFFKNIPYSKILISIFLASIGSLWILFFMLPSFVTLLLSSVLFFGIYFASLLLLKETMILTFVQQVTKVLPFHL